MSNFMPAPRHKSLYEGVSVPRRPNAGVPPTDKPALMQKIADVPPLGPDTGSSDKVILNRLRMLSAVDEGVGSLLKALEESGQLDNTLFVVTSDHGYFYGEHGLEHRATAGVRRKHSHSAPDAFSFDDQSRFNARSDRLDDRSRADVYRVWPAAQCRSRCKADRWCR